jgi:nucleotide-binding universal stress UspA family protein
MIQTASATHSRILAAVPELVDINDILVPSDLSLQSDRVTAHARLIADAVGARLTIYHVVQTPHRATTADPGVEEEALRRSAVWAQEHLDAQAALGPAGATAVVERHACVEDALVAHVREHATDLVVMATRGRGGLAHAFAGSITESLIHRGGRPVLCVREPDHGAALPYRRILLPTDLSPRSRRAFPWGALLASRFGAEVLALHVAEVTAPRMLVGTADVVEASPSEATVARFLGPAFRGVRVVPSVVFGAPWKVILETARAEHVDLVVVSTHGHDSLVDRILGSHAETVVRRAPCPVLVV